MAPCGRDPRGERCTVTRHFRMQLEGEPCRFDAALRHQPVDSHGVDVAPRSDEVGVDDELGRHGKSVGAGTALGARWSVRPLRRGATLTALGSSRNTFIRPCALARLWNIRLRPYIAGFVTNTASRA